MIQTYTAQLDGECMSVWNQTATNAMVVHVFMLNAHALPDRLQYFGQDMNPAGLLTFLKKIFYFFTKNFDQEGDQKHKINFAWPNLNFPFHKWSSLRPNLHISGYLYKRILLNAFTTCLHENNQTDRCMRL